MVDRGLFVTACLCWLAGNLFLVASIVSVYKKDIGAAFRNLLFGFCALIAVYVILP